MVPGSVLREVMKTRSPAELIDDLAVPHKSRAAFWRLMELGRSVVPVVEAGLRHPDPLVRAHCCLFFDHHMAEKAYPGLLTCLDDPDPRVRFHAAHALECERCKRDAWQPPDAGRRAAAAVLGGEPLPVDLFDTRHEVSTGR